MATIQSLPNELLTVIFSCVCDTQPYDGLRCRTLGAASLACRAWRRLAQASLLHEVHLALQTELKAFIEGTAATGLRTAHLEVGGVRGPAARAVIRACRGLESLEVWGVEDFDLQALAVPELARTLLFRTGGLFSTLTSSRLPPPLLQS